MVNPLKTTNLPHIKNMKAGINRWDPNNSNIFEVYFSLPAAIQSQFTEDEVILTQQVTKVDGLDALQLTTEAGTQRFMGVNVSFENPVLADTRATVTIEFNLNLRERVDNYVLKVFKAWSRLNYDLSDGTRVLKRDYIADNISIAEANRAGDVWRSYVFHDVLLTKIEGIGTLDYETNEARKITVTFISDYWDEDVA